MCVLNSSQIRHYIESGVRMPFSEYGKDRVPLIESADPEQMLYLECGQYELRVGHVELVHPTEPAILGVRERKTPPTMDAPVHEVYDPFRHNRWPLDPSSYFKITTLEAMNCPAFLRAVIEPKVTPQDGGLLVLCSSVGPGFHGQLVFGLYPLRPQALDSIDHGARVAKVWFMRVEGGDEPQPYRGPRAGGQSLSGTTQEW